MPTIIINHNGESLSFPRASHASMVMWLYLTIEDGFGALRSMPNDPEGSDDHPRRSISAIGMVSTRLPGGTSNGEVLAKLLEVHGALTRKMPYWGTQCTHDRHDDGSDGRRDDCHCAGHMWGPRSRDIR